MADRSQLSAPGSLANAEGITKVATPLPGEPLAELALKAGLKPSAAVIVATIRALKMHGGVAKEDLGKMLATASATHEAVAG